MPKTRDFTDLTRAPDQRSALRPETLKSQTRQPTATHLANPAAKRAPPSGAKRKKRIECCRPLLRVRTRGRETNGRAPIPQAAPAPSRDDRARQRPRKGDVGRRMPRHRREAARARRAGRGDEARQNVSRGEALRRVQKADGPDSRLGRPGAPVLFRRVRVFRRPTRSRLLRDGVEVASTAWLGRGARLRPCASHARRREMGTSQRRSCDGVASMASRWSTTSTPSTRPRTMKVRRRPTPRLEPDRKKRGRGAAAAAEADRPVPAYRFDGVGARNLIST